MLKVKVYHKPGVKLPEKSTPQSSAKDIRANLQLFEGDDSKIKGQGCCLEFRDSNATTGLETDSRYGDETKLCMVIKPHGRALIPSGIYIELPEGYSMDVRPRSGLALKYGITLLNSPGLVDEDYRGDIGMIVINTSRYDVIIVDGERLSQIKISKDKPFTWDVVNELPDLSETERGENGFNSTGTK